MEINAWLTVSFEIELILRRPEPCLGQFICFKKFISIEAQHSMAKEFKEKS